MAANSSDEQPSRPSRSIMRRRRANSPGGREERFVVKVSADEKALLEARAQLAGGISVQRLLVTAALSDQRGPSVDFETRRQAWEQACEVRNLIAGIGVNMNQIARQANSDKEVPEDFAGAVQGVNRAMARVLEAFGETFGFEGRRG